MKKVCHTRVSVRIPFRSLSAGENPPNIRNGKRWDEMGGIVVNLFHSNFMWVFPKIVGFPPKSSILIGFSIINHAFWGTPIFGNLHEDDLFATELLLLEVFFKDNFMFFFPSDFSVSQGSKIIVRSFEQRPKPWLFAVYTRVYYPTSIGIMIRLISH